MLAVAGARVSSMKILTCIRCGSRIGLVPDANARHVGPSTCRSCNRVTGEPEPLTHA